MNKRVLVTGAGGAAAVAFISAFKDGEYKFYAADADPNAAGLYLVPPDQRTIVPAAYSAKFVDFLVEICLVNRIDVLVPTVDAELLPIARSRARFEAIGTRVATASVETLSHCLDKARLMQVCEPTGCVPAWSIFDHTFAPDASKFPLLIKPRTGSGGRGVQIMRTKLACDAIPRSPDMLVQEYLPGEEYSVDVFARSDGHVLAAVPRVRMKIDSGVAVTARTVHDSLVAASAIAVARAIGVTGIANIQLRRDRWGTPRLLEVNPRLPGTMPLTVAAGVNMPRMLLESALGVEQSSQYLEFEEVAMVRTWKEHFMKPAELGCTKVKLPPDRVSSVQMAAVSVIGNADVA